MYLRPTLSVAPSPACLRPIVQKRARVCYFPRRQHRPAVSHPRQEYRFLAARRTLARQAVAAGFVCIGKGTWFNPESDVCYAIAGFHDDY